MDTTGRRDSIGEEGTMGVGPAIAPKQLVSRTFAGSFALKPKAQRKGSVGEGGEGDEAKEGQAELTEDSDGSLDLGDEDDENMSVSSDEELAEDEDSLAANKRRLKAILEVALFALCVAGDEALDEDALQAAEPKFFFDWSAQPETDPDLVKRLGDLGVPKNFVKGKSLRQAWLELISRRAGVWFRGAPDSELGRAMRAVLRARLLLSNNHVGAPPWTEMTTAAPATLEIRNLRASQLTALDMNGLSDPYAILTVDGVSLSTEVCYHTLAPRWEEENLNFSIMSADSFLQISVWDKDDKRLASRHSNSLLASHIHTCTHAYMHTCTHAHIHTQTHTYIHTHTHTHTKKKLNKNRAHISDKLLIENFHALWLRLECLRYQS